MQSERDKKFLEDMMKKRTSKINAFRQSKMPVLPSNKLNKNKNNDLGIDFLKGIT